VSALAPAWQHRNATLYQGSADAVFAALPAESVHVVCTSPPYYYQYGGIIAMIGGHMTTTSHCKQCGKDIVRAGSKTAVFCSNRCKGDWQRENKGISREWLYEQYVTLGLSTYAIAKVVHRNPKQVYAWLKGFAIPVRERQWSTAPSGDLPYQQEAFLRREYVERGLSAAEIAAPFGVTAGDILYHLRRLGINRRSVAEAREKKHWALAGEQNGMYGRRGAEAPSWKGGATPERQAFYSSEDWAVASLAVWRRDRGQCCRCGKKATTEPSDRMDVHHIISFAVPALRADSDNLVLLCRACHRFVHSKANVNHEWIKEWEGGDAYGTGLESR
jgi:endogenous inhibitor of DNA gyrase (YacG/DUF329 family)